MNSGKAPEIDAGAFHWQLYVKSVGGLVDLAGKNKKIRKYRKPLNLNIGMLIFGAVFIYVVICIILYFHTGHIVRYEVQKGSLASDNLYKGIILREESIVTADAAGYVNFYAREGERVAKDDLVYTVDETGRLAEYLESLSMGENSLSEKELAEFRSEITNFMHGFDPQNYDTVYNFKYSLKNTVLKLANSNMLQSIDDINGAGGVTNVVNFCTAPMSGIVAYWTDGYENLTADTVSEEMFDLKKYEKNQIIGNSLMATQDPVYKLCTDENWSIVIPVDPKRGEELEREGYIKVRFMKNQYESWGATKLLHNGDGNTYLQLSFSNSMITYISERFLDVELILEDETGLKIPNSSIVQKEFFLIPEEFVVVGEEDGSYGIVRQCYLEDGTVSTEFLPTDIYSYDEENKEYYLDTGIINTGDVLHKMDGQDTYTVSRKATLIGVYNMNKGYADFKQIIILYQNEEYSIVKANTQYGLNVYDYIVLNADSVTDDQFINE